MKQVLLLIAVIVAIPIMLIAAASCGPVQSAQSQLSGVPFRHEVGDGVICFTYHEGISCLDRKGR